jgi:hypothetical protein
MRGRAWSGSGDVNEWQAFVRQAGRELASGSRLSVRSIDGHPRPTVLALGALSLRKTLTEITRHPRASQ